MCYVALYILFVVVLVVLVVVQRYDKSCKQDESSHNRPPVEC